MWRPQHRGASAINEKIELGVSMKVVQLRFRRENKDIFKALREGKKKVETRAATEKYLSLKAGDQMQFVCGKSTFVRTIKRVRHRVSIESLLRVYKATDIHPKLSSRKEIEMMYASFPGYSKKIQQFGLFAFELE